MKKIITILGGVITSRFIFASSALAQNPTNEIVTYADNTLQIIMAVAAASSVIFIIRAGFLYMSSAGNPEAIASAKRTIRNVLIGLSLILAANIVTSVLHHSIDTSHLPGDDIGIGIVEIETAEPSDGLTQVLIDAVSGFIQNIVESATEPIVNGIISYLTTTPTLLNNSVIRNFWLINLGIVNTLFVLIVGLTGLQLMSADTFGFEETNIKHILPRLGLFFLAANLSLFLADYAIITNNTLVEAVLVSTDGLNHAFVINAINPTSLISGTTPLIILIFLVLFLIISIVLLLFYISRLIFIALGAVLSPYIFLLAAIPKLSSFAEISIKTYLSTVFVVFVHVVIIQLASSFLSLPDHNENSLISISVAIGLFITLLKTPMLMMKFVIYTSRSGTVKKLGNQIINVITTDNTSTKTRSEIKKITKKFNTSQL